MATKKQPKPKTTYMKFTDVKGISMIVFPKEHLKEQGTERLEDTFDISTTGRQASDEVIRRTGGKNYFNQSGTYNIEYLQQFLNHLLHIRKAYVTISLKKGKGKKNTGLNTIKMEAKLEYDKKLTFYLAPYEEE